MVFIGAHDQQRAVCLMGNQPSAEKRLLKRIIPIRKGQVRTLCLQLHGSLAGRGIMHGADKIGGAGKALVRCKKPVEKIMRFRQPSPAGAETNCGRPIPAFAGSCGKRQDHARQPLEPPHGAFLKPLHNRLLPGPCRR